MRGIDHSQRVQRGLVILIEAVPRSSVQPGAIAINVGVGNRKGSDGCSVIVLGEIVFVITAT